MQTLIHNDRFLYTRLFDITWQMKSMYEKVHGGWTLKGWRSEWWRNRNCRRDNWVMEIAVTRASRAYVFLPSIGQFVCTYTMPYTSPQTYKPQSASSIFFSLLALFTNISLVAAKISTYLIAEPVAALAQSIYLRTQIYWFIFWIAIMSWPFWEVWMF